MVNELSKTSRFQIKSIDALYNDDMSAVKVPLEGFDPTALPGTWHQLGYLDRSQVMEIVRSGGEVTVDDTLNELAVDSEQAPISRDITFGIEQQNLSILEAIYGPDLYDEVNDEFELPDQPVTKTRLYQLVIRTTKGDTKTILTPGSLTTTSDLSLDPAKKSAISVSIKCLKDNGKGIRLGGFGDAPVVPAG